MNPDLVVSTSITSLITSITSITSPSITSLNTIRSSKVTGEVVKCRDTVPNLPTIQVLVLLQVIRKGKKEKRVRRWIHFYWVLVFMRLKGLILEKYKQSMIHENKRFICCVSHCFVNVHSLP